MKIILPFIFLGISLNPQPACSQAEPLQVEWKTEFTVGGTAISGLAIHDKNIYVTQTGGASVFNILNSQGAITFTSLANNTRIRTLFIHDSFLYSMGDQHLTKRDLSGNLVEEKMLPFGQQGYISATDGKIQNGKAYAIHQHDYFFAFTLSGDQLFKKEIGVLTDNHRLVIGGNLIYVNSSISNPSQGSRLIQYDTLGNQKWSVAVGGVTNMFTDPAGYCYVITSAAGENSFLNKYNSDGSLAWRKETVGQWIVNGTVVDNKIYLAGQVTPGLTENPAGGAITIMDLKTASILEQYHYDLYPDGTDDGWSEQFTHIAVDGETIYVGGYSGIYPKCYLIKLSREGSTTSLKEETNSKTSFSIFPNPGGSQFSISCGQSDVSTLNVTVRNISGQVVYKKQISCNDQKTFTLDLGKQAAGNYSVEIVSGKDKTVKKIVVE